MANLYAGTGDGFYTLVENGGWRVASRSLEGTEIAQIAPEPGKPTVLVATRGQGLVRIDPTSGRATRLGQDVLPERVRCATAVGDGRRIYAGTEPVGIFTSDDAGATWRECAEVARMAGQLKWTYPVPTVPPHIRDIVVDRANPARMAAAVQVGSVIVSDDAGATWRHITGLDADVHNLAQDPRAADVLYASAGGGGAVDMKSMDKYPPPLPEGRPLYRSRDFGKSWECISLDFDRTYSVAIRVHPGDSNTLVAALGRDIPPFWAKRAEQADSVLMVSRDRGKTWSRAADGLPGCFKSMIEAVTFAPDGRAYLGTGGAKLDGHVPDMDGGLYMSDEVDRGWRRVPVDLPAVTSLLAAA
jgi:photosystem II stability/assembly factor-like uncharacterized protein